ncbi:MAG TPA: phosphonate ABC transporter ATP-binding protein [Agrobacterium sp.]|uniref:phosphonate ABC transporter ATP-binding protein n=1 Tax=Rhizobium sp. TaxID=391 RepID=UPI000EEEA31D|nr:phosphonate ABC transporter ATP-binding protein [Agrobacterium sp.]
MTCASQAAVLNIAGLTKTFKDRQVLKHLDFSVAPGEVVIVLGASGAGKTTLFKIVSGLMEPSKGTINFDGKNLGELSNKDRRLVRREMGFIFQQFNLVRRMNALSNVLAGRSGYTSTWRVLLRRFTKPDIDLAKRALASVGLAEFIWQRADSLSGGQQQRVAIARALAQQCRFILADEPVASLDPETSRAVLEMLKSIAAERQVGVLCSLHQVDLARMYGDRIIGLKDGRIAFDAAACDVDDVMIDRLYSDKPAKGSAPPIETQNDFPALAVTNNKAVLA